MQKSSGPLEARIRMTLKSPCRFSKKVGTQLFDFATVVVGTNSQRNPLHVLQLAAVFKRKK